jgi:peptidyl-tRNA hydrolase
MKLVAGLGNPGDKYRGTRHNVGFDVVDLIARRHGLVFEDWKAVGHLADWRRIDESLGTTDYPRLRVGVGRGDLRRDLADHVLGRFAPDESQAVEDTVARAADAVETWISDGLPKMMNLFNREERTETL